MTSLRPSREESASNCTFHLSGGTALSSFLIIGSLGLSKSNTCLRFHRNPDINAPFLLPGMEEMYIVISLNIEMSDNLARKRPGYKFILSYGNNSRLIFEERENSPLKLQKELKVGTQHKQRSLSAPNAIDRKTPKKRSLNVSATEDTFIVI